MISKIKEIFQWRQLIFSLAFKDIKIRYRQAIGGFGWMFINPLVQMVLFIFIFKFIFKIGIKNYPLFLLSGLFPWAYLASVINDASMAIIHNSSLIKKTNFARQVLPLATVLTQSVNFIFPLIVLFIFSLISSPGPVMVFIWLPLVILAQIILLTGLALMVSALNVEYRDVSFIINIILTVWFYVTPIVYPVGMARGLLSGWALRLYLANPMTGIITAYQDIFFYGRVPDALSIIGIIFVATLILGIGFWVFNRYEAKFEEAL